MENNKGIKKALMINAVVRLLCILIYTPCLIINLTKIVPNTAPFSIAMGVSFIVWIVVYFSCENYIKRQLSIMESEN